MKILGGSVSATMAEMHRCVDFWCVGLWCVDLCCVGLCCAVLSCWVFAAWMFVACVFGARFFVACRAVVHVEMGAPGTDTDTHDMSHRRGTLLAVAGAAAHNV